jgi:hypothetical protein
LEKETTPPHTQKTKNTQKTEANSKLKIIEMTVRAAALEFTTDPFSSQHSSRHPDQTTTHSHNNYSALIMGKNRKRRCSKAPMALTDHPGSNDYNVHTKGTKVIVDPNVDHRLLTHSLASTLPLSLPYSIRLRAAVDMHIPLLLLLVKCWVHPPAVRPKPTTQMHHPTPTPPTLPTTLLSSPRKI